MPLREVSNPQVESPIWNKSLPTSRRAFEDRFQRLARGTFDATFECCVGHDGTEIILALTRTVQELAGCSCDGATATEQWVHLIHPSDHRVVATHVQRVLDGHRDLCVFRVLVPAAGVRWFGTLTRPVWDGAGCQVTHVYGLVQDYAISMTATVSMSYWPADTSRIAF